MLVTELGIVIEFKPEHPQKAQYPILFTELGIVIEFKPEQFSKAKIPIAVTDSGIIVSEHPKIKVLDIVLFGGAQV